MCPVVLSSAQTDVTAIHIVWPDFTALHLDTKILMVLTSHVNLDNTELRTAFWLEEVAAPYYGFNKGGAEIRLASPFGRQPPIESKSGDADSQTDATPRFEADPVAKAAPSP